MKYLRPFDPWNSKLCTCGKKYSFNPYTGCSHHCLYCYATYIPNFFKVRVKKNLLRELEKDLEKLPNKSVVSMSNSSDPYPHLEKKLEITRNCLKIFKEYGIPLLIVTKSDIITRDIDLLLELNCTVSMSITGCDCLELNAPSTNARIDAFKKIKEAGIPTVLRFDPIVPGLNDNKLWIIETCDPDHVVTSTLKLKRDALNRILKFKPKIGLSLLRLYQSGERKGSYYYLPRDVRLNLLNKVTKLCNQLGITCGYCREGISFEAPSCDGQHLIRKENF